MSVTRVVANLPVSDAASARDLYAGLFALDVQMDHGWVASLWEWGVRRFFFRDPDGNVVNVVANA